MFMAKEPLGIIRSVTSVEISPTAVPDVGAFSQFGNDIDGAFGGTINSRLFMVMAKADGAKAIGIPSGAGVLLVKAVLFSDEVLVGSIPDCIGGAVGAGGGVWVGSCVGVGAGVGIGCGVGCVVGCTVG